MFFSITSPLGANFGHKGFIVNHFVYPGGLSLLFRRSDGICTPTSHPGENRHTWPLGVRWKSGFCILNCHGQSHEKQCQYVDYFDRALNIFFLVLEHVQFSVLWWMYESHQFFFFCLRLYVRSFRLIKSLYSTKFEIKVIFLSLCM
jgi:hypothetical protein